MEPIHYLRALRRHWWVIPTSVVVALAAAWITTAATSDTSPIPSTSAATYSATTVLWNQGTVTAGSGSQITNTETLAQVVTLPDVAARAAKLMDYQGDPLALRTQVQAFADEASGFLQITGYAGDGDTAEQIATAFSHALIDYLDELKVKQLDRQQQLLVQQIQVLKDQGASTAVLASLRVALSQLAIARTTPVAISSIQEAEAEVVPAVGFQPPKSSLSRMLLAALLGLLAGVALALLLERFDTKIRDQRRAEEILQIPVLAEIPVMSRRRRKSILTNSYPTSRAADAFRLLGAGISRWGSDEDGSAGSEANGTGAVPSHRPRHKMTVLVTSPEARDGKSTVAANLAAAYAETENRVLVISCDLRRPTVHRVLHAHDGPGLTELVTATNDPRAQGMVDVGPYIEPTSVDRVAVLPSGGRTANPGELLGSLGTQRVLERLKTMTDVIVMDCAPLLVASDVVPLLPQVDAVVLVVRAGKTHADVASRSTSLLQRLGANVVGVVLNESRESSTSVTRRGSYRPYQRTQKENATPPVLESRGSDEGRDMWAGP